MDSVWQRAESSSIQPIRSWYNGTPKAYGSTPVFYPLSGADFINMYLLYPDSKEYVMAAMEETGNVTIHPDPATALKNLNALRGAVHLYFVQNYFQTRIMNETFRENQNLRGVLPVLLVFMKRTGLFIKKVETMPDADGAVISFSERPEGETRTLRYYHRKLENSFQPSELGLKQYRLIMKSAVYLLQMNEYQTLADTILNSSVMVIQDDSGLSYSRFRNDGWKVNLYGSYHRVRVKGTQYIYQKDLQEDLQEDLASSGEPLPFQFGYGTLSGKDKSNLMIAIRSGKN